MISIYVFPLFLWICLALQAPVQGIYFEIQTVRRRDLGDEFELSLGFKGDLKRENIQWVKVCKHTDIPLTGYELADGKMTLTITKLTTLYCDVALILDDLLGHYLYLSWNIRGEGDLSAHLAFSPATVIPATSLPYALIQEAKVIIAFDKKRGNGFLHPHTSHCHFVAWYRNETTQQIVFDENPFFIKEHLLDGTDVSTTILEFDPVKTIPGNFSSFLLYTEEPGTSLPLTGITENIRLTVHKK